MYAEGWDVPSNINVSDLSIQEVQLAIRDLTSSTFRLFSNLYNFLVLDLFSLKDYDDDIKFHAKAINDHPTTPYAKIAL